MSEDGGITRLSIGFNKIAAVIKVAPLYSIQIAITVYNSISMYYILQIYIIHCYCIKPKLGRMRPFLLKRGGETNIFFMSPDSRLEHQH